MVGIQEAAAFLGVAPQTLRRWEREGRLFPDARTLGGRRRYDLSRLRLTQIHASDTRCTIAYARDVHGDLDRRKRVLERYCTQQGWTFEVIADPGSDVPSRTAWKRFVNALINGQVGRLVITHKCQLPRTKEEWVFDICEAKNIEVVILNLGDRQGLDSADEPSFEEDSPHDIMRDDGASAVESAG